MPTDMPGLSDLLGSVLTPDTISSLAGQIGADPNSTSKALTAAIPALVGSLSDNANGSDEGRDALFGALQNDHDGSVLDDIGGLLGAFGGGSGSSGGGNGGGLGDLLGAATGILGSLSGGGSAPSRATNGEGILKHALGDKRNSVEQAMSAASGLDLSQVAKLLPLAAPLVMAALGKLTKQGGLDASGVADLLLGEKDGIAGIAGNLLKGLFGG
ncbi:DUF937 domain-containing protein [Bacteroidota bacterium]